MDVHNYKNDISIISYSPTRYYFEDTVKTPEQTYANGRVSSNSRLDKYLDPNVNNVNQIKISQKHFLCTKTNLIIIITTASIATLLIIAAIVATVTVLLIKNNSSSNSNSSNNVIHVVSSFNRTANLTFLNNLTDCGVPNIQPKTISGRIIGGSEAIPHSWPYVVSIGYVGPKATYKHVCGGTLISKRYVLTAAHCTLKKSIYGLTGDPIPSDPRYSSLENMIRIYIGVHNRDIDINENTTYYSEKVITHENFDTSTFENDISLIRLSRDADISTNVGYVCLKSNIDIIPNQSLYAVGWGYTSYIAIPSTVLMQVQLPITPASSCVFQYIQNKQFCGGNRAGIQDTCGGDSGGPTMKLINQKWTLVGIVSNGDSSCSGVGIYTNVDYYLDWIGDNIIL